MERGKKDQFGSDIKLIYSVYWFNIRLRIRFNNQLTQKSITDTNTF